MTEKKDRFIDSGENIRVFADTQPHKQFVCFKPNERIMLIAHVCDREKNSVRIRFCETFVFVK